MRTHPQCNQRVVIPFGGRLDQADVHMDVGGELFVKDQRIHPKILPDMRLIPGWAGVIQSPKALLSLTTPTFLL